MNEQNISDNQPASKQKSSAREWTEAIIIALLLALFIRTFVVQAFKIPSGSMKDTLLIGDHILVSKFIYGIKIPFSGNVLIPFKKPARNDIIVFRYPQNPEKDYIKRVIGTPGDKLEIVNKKIFINDQPYDDQYGIYLDSTIYPREVQPRDNFGPVVVPEHSYFVMGDNRDNSYDSRFWNYVDIKAVKGKAFMLYWSWDRESFAWQWNHILPVRWSRIGDLVH